MNQDQIELLNYLRNEKSKAEAWVAEDPENRWSSFPVQEIEYWEEQGIDSVQKYKHHMNVTEAYDLFKDVYGYRTDWSKLYAMGADELDSFIDDLCVRLEANNKAEEIETANAITDFKALIKKTISYGAENQTQALKWLICDEKFYNVQCVKSWVWKHGFLFTDYGKAIVEELMNIVTFES